MNNIRPIGNPKKIAKYGDDSIMLINFERKDAYDREELREYCQKVSDRVKNINPDSHIAVILKFENIGWKSGGYSKAGEPVYMYEIYEGGLKEIGNIIQFQIHYTGK